MKHQGVVVLLAIAAALAPVPRAAVERWYSTGVYPRLQIVMTSAANPIPIALMDVAAALVLAFAVGIFVRRVRAAGLRRAAARSAVSLVYGAAVAYVLFLVLWGLNYRRVPLEEKLDYDRSRVTRSGEIALANAAATAMNKGYAAAHALRPDAASLAQSSADVQRALGARRAAVPGTPKRSLAALYLRRAAIDGMTDPFFLEIIVNPDVLDIERPFVIAHEWAHLAGYADESDANFVAWLTCVRGDSLAQYSGWVAAYLVASAGLPREDRRHLTPLDAGPGDDLRAIAARLDRSSPAIRRAARDVYDGYLRANRVAEGIESYDAVLGLMLGTRFNSGWTPRAR